MSNLTINYVNIGQGDCTLIVCPDGTTIMIDCGNHHGANDDAYQAKREGKDTAKATWTKLKRMKVSMRPLNYANKLQTAAADMKKYADLYAKAKKDSNDETRLEIETSVAAFLPKKKKVDYLILTHHDVDHYNKIASLTLLGVTFGKIYYSGPIEKYSALRRNYYPPTNVDKYISVTINGILKANQTIIEKATDVTIVCQTTKLTIFSDATNGVAVDILASNVHTNPADKVQIVNGFHYSAEDINGRSIVTMITYKKDKIIVLGDATTETEGFLVPTYSVALQADTLRVGHHGSLTSSSQTFIDTVKPQTALISSAQYNSYGLPRQTITNRYIQYFTVNAVPNVVAHDLSYYLNDTDYATSSIPQPLWQTWSVGDTKFEYDGA